MVIQFIGDFKQLIPMGYKFSRLYARNYICYHQKEIWIWKKGKDVEIADFYGKSHVLLSYLIKNGFTVPNEFNMIMLNMETSEIEDYERTKHSDIHLMGKLSDEEMEKFYNRYHRKFIQQETIDELKRLYEQNLIKINEEESEGK
jgi:hypothetical protein